MIGCTNQRDTIARSAVTHSLPLWQRSPASHAAARDADDRTALKTEGICDLFERFPQVKAKVDAGYRGLAKQFPDQVEAPPQKPKKDASPEEMAHWEAARTKQSSERIPVEHANAEHKQWRPLQRWIGRREYYDETHLAIAALLSDRTAMR
ncbi:transposase [Streptomyces sp. NPDC002573]|uniref:transposase n=1 Tax=Streptomyces sp. NPDC002573 TaxID=3364651 RepID=UPI0036812FC5